MDWILDVASQRFSWAKTSAGLAIAGILVLGAAVGTARAEDRGHRGGDRRGGDERGWHGSYYRAPPVVYGGDYIAPGYYPPPVVYGAGIGITLPGINLNFR